LLFVTFCSYQKLHMNKLNAQEIAELFSAGKFSEVENHLSDDIVWNIYEEKKILTGKKPVMEFMKKIGEYFRSVTTKFETFGVLEDGDKVAIYGRAEFIRGSKTVNTVYSCDVYIFNPFGQIRKVHSYCNSNRPQIDFESNK
jgi:phage host-nuclease inhibitor protein Gam